MNDLLGSPDYFDDFRNGSSEAFRHYFHLHHYRIYCYLLRDADHLVCSLYLLARVAYQLYLKQKLSVRALEVELAFYTLDDPNIMEDPEVMQNETLIALQLSLQKLPPNKKEVAELYFFQGFTVKSIAEYLKTNEQIVKEYLSEIVQWLGNEVAGRNGDRNIYCLGHNCKILA
jgi:RNA polymerase sigma factor (sigma-70 family)